MKFIFFAILILTSCSHRVEVAPDDLITKISEYKKSGEIEASYDGQKLVVSEEMNPRIYVKTTRVCGFWTGLISGCESDLAGGDLGDVIVNQDTFSFEGITPGKVLPKLHNVTLREPEILEMELSIDHVPENWNPTFALGLAGGGPVQFIGFQLHWFPIDALGFDIAGGIPVFGALAGGGLRIRPFRFGRVLPFLGAATSFSYTPSHVIEGDISVAPRARFLVGPRAGVDFEFANRRFLLGIEVDLFYDISKEGFIYDLENKSTSVWKPFGGIYFAYQM